MRINPDSTADFLAALARTQRQQETALQQLASGRRLNRPSDDPAGMAALIQNRSRFSRNDVFSQNASTLKARFGTADAALNSVVQQLERAVTLGVRGSNGTLSAADRDAIAQELQGIYANILADANTSFQGTYLFAGTETKTAPFQVDGTAASGVSYCGNSDVNTVVIGENRTVAINVAGDEIFTSPGADVFAALHGLIEALATDDAAATVNATAAVKSAFDHVSSKRVFYGNAVAQLEAEDVVLASDKLQIQQQEDDIAAADQAETITRLLGAQQARDTALEAAGRLSRLSLLDYLG